MGDEVSLYLLSRTVFDSFGAYPSYASYISDTSGVNAIPSHLANMLMSSISIPHKGSPGMDYI